MNGDGADGIAAKALGLLLTRRPRKETQMERREVVEHPSPKDLPFKIETNADDHITMTAFVGGAPAKPHRAHQTGANADDPAGTANLCPP